MDLRPAATVPLLALWLAGCAAASVATPSAPPVPVPSAAEDVRLASIPQQMVKRMPATDGHPPILYAVGWAEPIPLPGLVNTAGAEDSPFLTPDGRQLFFFFTPDLHVPPEQQLTDGVSGIYLSTMGADGWGLPRRVVLQDRGQPSLDGCPTLLGDLLWFCSARPGNYRGVDLWTARLRDGAWEGWENAGQQLNADYAAGEMHPTADGSAMVFHRADPVTQDRDLWWTERSGQVWTEPRSLAAVNTTADEGWPYLSLDGQELWFTRIHQGAPGVFRSVWGPSGWSTPELIVWPFAGEPTLDAAGNLVFVHHFLEQDRLIEADLYVAYRLTD